MLLSGDLEGTSTKRNSLMEGRVVVMPELPPYTHMHSVWKLRERSQEVLEGFMDHGGPRPQEESSSNIRPGSGGYVGGDIELNILVNLPSLQI